MMEKLHFAGLKSSQKRGRRQLCFPKNKATPYLNHASFYLLVKWFFCWGRTFTSCALSVLYHHLFSFAFFNEYSNNYCITEVQKRGGGGGSWCSRGGKQIRPMLMFCSWQLWGNLNCPCGVRLTAASEQVPVTSCGCSFWILGAFSQPGRGVEWEL